MPSISVFDCSSYGEQRLLDESSYFFFGGGAGGAMTA
jgi:hypothetical protein